MTTFATPVQGALHVNESYGWKVLPCWPNQKVSAVSQWEEWADSAKRGTIITKSGEDRFNWAWVPGATGHMVLDVDAKPQRNGFVTLVDLERINGKLPATLTFQTPSGGRHLIFKASDIPPSAGRVGEGLDVRGMHSYALLPGSEIDGHSYRIIDELPIADAPEWLIRAAQTIAEKGVKTHNYDVTPDTQEKIDQAIVYLKDTPPAIEGQGGDDRLYKVAAQLHDLGLTLEKAIEMALEHYNPRCQPPWEMNDQEDMLHFHAKFNNAYEYAQNDFGVKSGEVAIQSAQDAFKPIPKPSTLVLPFRCASGIDGLTIPTRKWVISNMAIKGHASFTAAPGGTGKTNLEILKAMSVATGRDLLGDRYKVIEPGAVLVYNGEDPDDELDRRVEAFRVYLGMERDDLKNLHLMSGQTHRLLLGIAGQDGNPQLNQEVINSIIATAKAVGAVMVSFDPFVSTHRLKENDNDAMDVLMDGYKDIAHKANVAVSIVHHTNKAAVGNKTDDTDSAKHVRGAGSLVNAARIAHVLTTMREDDAKALGIPSERRKWFFKVELAKANLSAPAELADWFEAAEQEIPNGEKIGVCKAAKLAVQKVQKETAFLNAQAKSVIAFLTDNIKPGDLAPLAGLIKLAEMKAVEFYDSNTSRFKQIIENTIAFYPEFELVNVGNVRARYSVRRRNLEQEALDVLS